MSESFSEVQRIYAAACHLPEDERSAFLSSECEGRAELRGQVERLLAHFDDPPPVLETSLSELAAQAGSPKGRDLPTLLSERLEHLAGPAPDEGQDPDSTQRTPRYRIGREIGRGGMGVVVEAFDDGLRRTLAMKRIHGGGAKAVSPSILSRFLDEVQVTAQLEHPGVVPVHELGVDAEERVFYTMPFVRGEHLGAVFERVWAGEEGWTLPRAIQVLLRVGEAMDYAHSRGVIHRDLKPANVMVGRFGEVYVMDWGLAKVLGSSEVETGGSIEAPEGVRTDRGDSAAGESQAFDATLAGQILGTPGFAAPEQTLGQLDRLGPQADVFSIGAMLYHLLARHSPYGDVPTPAGQELAAVLRFAREQPPTPLAVAAPDAPPELVAICERAMAREPDRRYASMRALDEDLQAWLSGRVVRAFERGPWAELKKWVQRNAKLAAAIASAVLLAFAGVLGMLGLSQRHNAALADANEEIRLEAETAERVVRFLVDMFEDQGPDRARGEDVTVKEVLDREAPRIAAELEEEPEIRARLMHTMGSVYMGLGLQESAADLLEQALETREEVLGEVHLDTLETVRNLGTSLNAQSRYEEAEELVAPALERSLRAHGEDHRATLELTLGLAQTRRLEGHYEESLELHGQILVSLERSGQDPGLVVFAAGSQASLLVEMGRFREAEATLVALHDDVLEARGPDSLESITSSSNLARLYEQLGRYDEAAELLRPALALSRRTLGDAHATTLDLLNQLAIALRGLGDDPGAEQAYLEAIRGHRGTRGEDDPKLLITRTNLAVLLAATGRLEEAEEIHRDVLERRRRTLGAAHLGTLDSMGGLGTIYASRGLHREALEIYREVLAGRATALGESHLKTLDSRFIVGKLLGDLEEYTEAESELRITAEAQLDVLGPAHPDRVRTLRGLVTVLRKAGRPEKAIAIRRDLLEDVTDGLGQDHAETLFATHELAIDLWKAGEAEEAEALHRLAIEGLRSHPERPKLGRVLDELAKHLEAAGRLEEALPFALEALELTPSENERRKRRERAVKRIRRALERG